MDFFARFPTFQKGFWIRLALGNRWDIIVAGGSSVFAINILGWIKFEHACHLTNMSPTPWQRRVCLEHLLCDMKRMLPKLLKIQFIFLQRQKLLRNTSMSSDRESLSLLVCSKCRESWKSWFISYHMYVLYFVNFIHTIKTSNLQFCVVIKSSLFWPKKRQLLVVWEYRSFLKLHWNLNVFSHQFVDIVTHLVWVSMMFGNVNSFGPSCPGKKAIREVIK